MKTKKTVIFMGYSCNNNCIFCCNSNRRKNPKDQSTRSIKKTILEAKASGSDYLELIGGEPTIRKDLPDLINYAKSLGFKVVTFATNGRTLSNQSLTQKIVDSGVTSIIFSIHGHNSNLHDRLTKVPGSFNQLKKGIANLKKLNFSNIGSNTTIVKQNYKHLLNIGKTIYNLGIRNSEFIFVDPTRGAPNKFFNKLVPTYEETSNNINNLLDFGRKNKIPHWHIRYYPLCFIHKDNYGKVSEIHEKKSFKTSHLAPDFKNENVEKNREKIGRIKLPKCKACKQGDICEGYWREYVKNKKS